eukprot:Sspe_Gene.26840::Locus_11309_Transcript_1_1_Confidence_1.000_Length_1818::g.26840::m.26840
MSPGRLWDTQRGAASFFCWGSVLALLLLLLVPFSTLDLGWRRWRRRVLGFVVWCAVPLQDDALADWLDRPHGGWLGGVDDCAATLETIPYVRVADLGGWLAVKNRGVAVRSGPSQALQQVGTGSKRRGLGHGLPHSPRCVGLVAVVLESELVVLVQLTAHGAHKFNGGLRAGVLLFCCRLFLLVLLWLRLELGSTPLGLEDGWLDVDPVLHLKQLVVHVPLPPQSKSLFLPLLVVRLGEVVCCRLSDLWDGFVGRPLECCFGWGVLIFLVLRGGLVHTPGGHLAAVRDPRNLGPQIMALHPRKRRVALHGCVEIPCEELLDAPRSLHVDGHDVGELCPLREVVTNGHIIPVPVQPRLVGGLGGDD